jgi:hypothetical protein
MATTTTSDDPLTVELQTEDGHFINIALSDDKLTTQRGIPLFRLMMMEPGDCPESYGACAAGEYNTAGGAGHRQRHHRCVRRAARPGRTHPRCTATPNRRLIGSAP